MIGIDTNVLLRLLIRDDEAQFRRLLAHIETGAWSSGAMVNAVVLVEAVWVLTKVLERSKAEVIDFVENLLATDGVSVQHESAVVRAVSRYRGATCEFADCLIAEINVDAGVTTTLTFDAGALKLPDFSPIP